ncbi:hypothetical protein BC941DRAFT_407505 [Chlamydoabsidia padenii]|nr:hypothetical protein BC941DRAFT_407505 [Chlamydoabsidia padenii]
MGFMDTIKRRYELRQVDKYTKRRMFQSQFESKDKNYYNSIYMDGAYLHDRDNSGGNSSRSSNNGLSITSTSTSSVHRQERWSLPSFLRRHSYRQEHTLATQQNKTSESYTLNG